MQVFLHVLDSSLTKLAIFSSEGGGGIANSGCENGADLPSTTFRSWSHEIDVSNRGIVGAAARSKAAAICEHASHSPAMHVQWEHVIVPHPSAATQGFSDGAVTDCECLTLAVKIFFPFLPQLTGYTVTPPTQPASKYL